MQKVAESLGGNDGPIYGVGWYVNDAPARCWCESKSMVEIRLSIAWRGKAIFAHIEYGYVAATNVSSSSNSNDARPVCIPPRSQTDQQAHPRRALCCAMLQTPYQAMHRPMISFHILVSHLLTTLSPSYLIPDPHSPSIRPLRQCPRNSTYDLHTAVSSYSKPSHANRRVKLTSPSQYAQKYTPTPIT
jgi:hypothetical protein